jgi:5-methylcytosine-specific restriction endonuclease McrA
MKICWDTLERVKITCKGNFSIHGCTYYEYEACPICGESYLGQGRKSKSCSPSCANSFEERKQKLAAIGVLNKGHIHDEKSKKNMRDNHADFSGENHPNWKGGVKVANIPLYDTYEPKLTPYEECKRSEQDPNILEVKCTYCGKWHTPHVGKVISRVGYINGRGSKESRFYCSDSCKQECPIFWKRTRYRGQDGENSREVQPELRQLVFARDKYECQKCGSKDSLHCHHYEGVEHNPIESADVDMCITLCKSCHKETHKEKGCRYYDLRKCP